MHGVWRCHSYDIMNDLLLDGSSTHLTCNIFVIMLDVPVINIIMIN